MDAQNDGLTILPDNEGYLDHVDFAHGLIEEKRLDEALNLLEDIISKKPIGWIPYKESSEFIEGCFWNKQEFLNFVEYNKLRQDKSIYWRLPSYSKAHFLLGYLLSEQGNLNEALKEINRGLMLEPDHPKLLSEKGYIFGKLGDDEKSLYFHKMAETARSWISAQEKSRYLRDQAVTLVNMNRLDEAEVALNKAYSLNPENESLQQDFKRIQELQQKNQKENSVGIGSETSQQMEDMWRIYQEKGNDGVVEWLKSKENIEN